jgi:selenide,water dikinase
VVRGGRKACADAGIPLAGGHSIDAPEPIFGLAVNGLVQHEHLKRNSGARPGDRVYLTKPLGVGVLTTAEKKGLLRPEWEGVAAQAMTTLNRVGTALGRLPGVTALTDVTGFGLLGHGLEMAQGSGAVLEISAPAVRLLAGARACLDAGAVPGGTRRNLRAYGDHVEVGDDATRDLFADPQTSGGLLVACDPAEIASLEAVFRAHGLVDFLQPIGAFLAGTPRVSVVGSVGV